MIEHEQVVTLIKKFADTPEVYETAMYCLYSGYVTLSAEGCTANQLTSVPNIPPEALLMMNRYAAGTVKNKFYLENYAPISVALVQDQLKAKVLFAYARGVDKGVNNARMLMRDMIAQRYDSIITVIFLHAGFDKAYEFTLEFKTLFGASRQEVLNINESAVVK